MRREMEVSWLAWERQRVECKEGKANPELALIPILCKGIHAQNAL